MDYQILHPKQAIVKNETRVLGAQHMGWEGGFIRLPGYGHTDSIASLKLYERVSGRFCCGLLPEDKDTRQIPAIGQSTDHGARGCLCD